MLLYCEVPLIQQHPEKNKLSDTSVLSVYDLNMLVQKLICLSLDGTQVKNRFIVRLSTYYLNAWHVIFHFPLSCPLNPLVEWIRRYDIDTIITDVPNTVSFMGPSLQNNRVSC